MTKRPHPNLTQGFVICSKCFQFISTTIIICELLLTNTSISQIFISSINCLKKFFHGVRGGIRTLASGLLNYSLSRGAPSASWVLGHLRDFNSPLTSSQRLKSRGSYGMLRLSMLSSANRPSYIVRCLSLSDFRYEPVLF